MTFRLQFGTVDAAETVVAVIARHGQDHRRRALDRRDVVFAGVIAASVVDAGVASLLLLLLRFQRKLRFFFLLLGGCHGVLMFPTTVVVGLHESHLTATEQIGFR